MLQRVPGSRHLVSCLLAPFIVMAASKARAQTMFLTAANEDVATKTGVTLGGAEIQDNGKWNGKWMRLTNSAAGQFTLQLPASTAAIVKITGR